MGSSTVYDRNTQKNAKNGNTELKKTGIAPVVRDVKKFLNGPVWTSVDKMNDDRHFRSPCCLYSPLSSM